MTGTSKAECLGPTPTQHAQDSYLILEKLPAEYDSRVKAMEVDTKPTEEWGDIGGCDKQIQVCALGLVGFFGVDGC